MEGRIELALDSGQLSSLQSLFEYIRTKGLQVVFIESPLPKALGETPCTKSAKQRLGRLIAEADLFTWTETPISTWGMQSILQTTTTFQQRD